MVRLLTLSLVVPCTCRRHILLSILLSLRLHHLLPIIVSHAVLILMHTAVKLLLSIMLVSFSKVVAYLELAMMLQVIICLLLLI